NSLSKLVNDSSLRFQHDVRQHPGSVTPGAASLFGHYENISTKYRDRRTASVLHRHGSPRPLRIVCRLLAPIDVADALVLYLVRFLFRPVWEIATFGIQSTLGTTRYPISGVVTDYFSYRHHREMVGANRDVAPPVYGMARRYRSFNLLDVGLVPSQPSDFCCYSEVSGTLPPLDGLGCRGRGYFGFSSFRVFRSCGYSGWSPFC